MEGVVFADQPNPELYQLNGKIHLKYNYFKLEKNVIFLIQI